MSFNFHIFTIMFIIFQFPVVYSAEKQYKGDRDALIQIDKDMDVNNMLNWFDPFDGSDPGDGGEWDCIIWKDGRVVGIHMPVSRGLAGSSIAFDKLTNLREMVLPHNWELENIRSFSALVELQCLNLSGCMKISDISSLQDLQRLSDLSLGSERIKGVPPSQITCIEPLQKLINIKNLELKKTLVSDFTPLKNLTSIQKLDLSVNHISDYSFLERLTDLQELSLSDNGLKHIDIFPITQINLQTLQLSMNSISNIIPLQNLKSLRHLYLALNPIEDISPLQYLHNLEKVNLESAMIKNISPLINLKELWDLHLGNNQISYIPSLNKMQSLEYLNLVNNEISMADGLLTAPSNTLLFIQDNRLPLSQLYRLMSKKYVSFGIQCEVALPQLVSPLVIGDKYDLNTEINIGGTRTVITVLCKNKGTATEGIEYNLTPEGMLSFLVPGEYQLKMENDLIYSHGKIGIVITSDEPKVFLGSDDYQFPFTADGSIKPLARNDYLTLISSSSLYFQDQLKHYWEYVSHPSLGPIDFSALQLKDKRAIVYTKFFKVMDIKHSMDIRK